jgi:hypothetical protein
MFVVSHCNYRALKILKNRIRQLATSNFIESLLTHLKLSHQTRGVIASRKSKVTPKRRQSKNTGWKSSHRKSGEFTKTFFKNERLKDTPTM